MSSLAAQPRFSFDWPAVAARLVGQLALVPGERVLIVAHPGTFEELVPHVRYAVMKAGGVDLGVLDVLSHPVPEALNSEVLAAGIAVNPDKTSGQNTAIKKCTQFTFHKPRNHTSALLLPV